MSVDKEMLMALYEHSNWANDRLLDQCARLPAGQMRSPITGAYGSIEQTMCHMMAAQKSWLGRFQGQEPEKPLEPEDFSSFDEMRQAWDALNEETIAYVETLSPEDLEEVFTYRGWTGWEGTGPRWSILLHQAVHQHQHRGEVALALTTLGYSPGEIDVQDYLESK